jgi:hypothetical protein
LLGIPVYFVTSGARHKAGIVPQTAEIAQSRQ